MNTKADFKVDTLINLKKATIFSLCAALSLSIMASFVKLAAPHIHNNMIIFFRFMISFIYIFSIFLIKKMKKMYFPIKTQHFKLHVLRAIASMMIMLLLYYSLAYIHLVDANLLFMTNPLFVPIFTLLLFHIKTSKKNWLFIISAFIGITLIIKPGHELFNPVSLIALSSGIIAGLTILIIRILSIYDHPHTCMFYYFSLAFLFSGIISIFYWETPNLHTLILLLPIGIFGTCYQEFLIRASQFAQARIVSTLMYTSIIFSGLIGWQVWGEIPDLLSWIGIILVCTGSILTLLFAKNS
ncbi:MAG: DMT family transporter [Gammaproteobacteria bacterium]|jgi:drug/metabolite transporter (DMT)-like permease